MNHIQEYQLQYDQICNQKQNCSLSLDIKSDIEGPVYFYYSLFNYFQNHRQYYKSKSIQQLKGQILSTSELSDCSPIIDNDDLWQVQAIASMQIQALDGTLLENEASANPCGLIASTLFNGNLI